MKMPYCRKLLTLSFIMVAISNAGGHVAQKKKRELNRLSVGFIWPGNLFGPSYPISFQLGIASAKHLLPGFEIAYLIRNTYCNPKEGMKGAVELRRSLGTLDGIIGDICSVVCEPVGLLAAALNIPQVSTYCSSAVLSDKKTYPTFARLRGTQDGYIEGMIAMFKMFNWTRMSIICDTAPLFKVTAEKIKSRLEDYGITVYFYTLKSTIVGGKLDKTNFELMRKAILEVKKFTRVTLIFMYTQDNRHLLILAKREGLMNGGHLIFGTDQVHAGSRGQRYIEPDLEDSEVYNGVLTFAITEPSRPVLDEFVSKVMDITFEKNTSTEGPFANKRRHRQIIGKSNSL